MRVQIITEDDLAEHMRQEFPDADGTGLQPLSALRATRQGQSAVLAYLRRPNLDAVPDYARDVLVLVMLRQAAAIFRTPGNERTSFSNGEVSVGLNPRILTEDEKVILRQWRKRRERGTIMLAVPGATDSGLGL